MAAQPPIAVSKDHAPARFTHARVYGRRILAGALLAPAMLAPAITLAQSESTEPAALPAPFSDPSEVSTQKIELPKGEITLRVDRLNFVGEVSDGKTTLPLDTGYMPDPAAHFGDAVLLFVSTGGSACPGMFTWVTLDENGLSQSPEFGTCSDLAEVEKTDEAAIVVIPRIDGSGDSAFSFDGKTITETDRGPQAAGLDNPRDGSTWLGLRASEIFAAAEMEPILLEIMPKETLDELRISSQLSINEIAEDGDWYAGAGCRPHACDAELGGIAIHKTDGRVIAASWNSETGGQTYGDPPKILPRVLQNVLAGQL